MPGKKAKKAAVKNASGGAAGTPDTAQIFDKIFKRILTLSSGAVVSLLNGIFHKNYPPGSRISYHWTENIGNSLRKTISDNLLRVNGKDMYHAEVQIDYDSAISVRMFEYGFHDAIKYKTKAAGKTVLDFPFQKIIYLEHADSTPDEEALEIHFPDQGSYSYRVPVMKLLNYSVAELADQNMVALLPLYLLKLRREIEKNNVPDAMGGMRKN